MNTPLGGLFQPSILGFAAAASPNAMTLMFAMADLATRQRSLQSHYGEVVSMDVAPGGGDPQAKFYASAGPMGDILIPAVANWDYKFSVFAADRRGLTFFTSSNVHLSAGEIKEVGLPMMPRLLYRSVTPPTIVAGQFNFGDATSPGPRVVLTGRQFVQDNPYAGASTLGSSLSDIVVTLELGGRYNLDASGVVVPVGGRDVVIPGSALSWGRDLEGGLREVIVPIPDNALLGPATITVTRPMDQPFQGGFIKQQYTSNPVQLLGPDGTYLPWMMSISS